MLAERYQMLEIENIRAERYQMLEIGNIRLVRDAGDPQMLVFKCETHFLLI